MTLEVLKPGAQSMLQDRGRHGYQRFGVPVAGAMDEWSSRLANALVGNDDGAATLEIVLTGPSLRVRDTALIAVCGADLAPTVTGASGTERLPHGRPVWVRAGGRIDFGARRADAGVRAYLAVCGGFDVPLVMGSRSTYLRGGFGGFAGRALARGDLLSVGTSSVVADPAATAAAAFWRSISGSLMRPSSPLTVPPVTVAEVETIRLIPGAQWNAFTAESREQLLAAEYRIGVQSDRMGYRLEGPVLERVQPIEMISEGVNCGTVQVPPDGQPIVLMADRGTSGGYPKIAEVASVDRWRLAQLAPGHRLRFAPITLADAQRILLAREREYSHVSRIMRAPPVPFRRQRARP
ncbi:MAG: biotin-dependent carboxyltransferase family protein [Lautropia sp.]